MKMDMVHEIELSLLLLLLLLFVQTWSVCGENKHWGMIFSLLIIFIKGTLLCRGSFSKCK